MWKQLPLDIRFCKSKESETKNRTILGHLFQLWTEIRKVLLKPVPSPYRNPKTSSKSTSLSTERTLFFRLKPKRKCRIRNFLSW